jgi:hypothetical protein
MPSLRTALNDLATSFAESVLTAIRTASLEELLSNGGLTGRGRPAAAHATRARGGGGQPAKARRRGSRLARRSAADIERTLGTVVAALKAGPMRSEQIQKALGLDKRELPRVLKHGLATNKLKSKGEKRARTYSLA